MHVLPSPRRGEHALSGTGEKDVSVWIESFGDMKLEEAEFAANVAYGARLRFYRFDKYKTKEKPEQKPSLKRLNMLVADASEAKRSFDPMDKVVDAVTFTSASTVQNFARIFGEEQAADLLNATVVASIGPVTAEAAQQLGIRTTIMPSTYTIPALVDAIVQHFRAAASRE